MNLPSLHTANPQGCRFGAASVQRQALELTRHAFCSSYLRIQAVPGLVMLPGFTDRPSTAMLGKPEPQRLGPQPSLCGLASHAGSTGSIYIAHAAFRIKYCRSATANHSTHPPACPKLLDNSSIGSLKHLCMQALGTAPLLAVKRLCLSLSCCFPSTLRESRSCKVT